MAIPVPLRGYFDAARLRGLAKKTKDGPQARRLLALAAIYDGATRTDAARILYTASVMLLSRCIARNA